MFGQDGRIRKLNDFQFRDARMTRQGEGRPVGLQIAESLPLLKPKVSHPSHLPLLLLRSTCDSLSLSCMEAASLEDFSTHRTALIQTLDKGIQIVPEDTTASNDAPQDTCVICLERISERAVAVPCNHLNFDFLCLVSWLQENPSCPLCKAKLTHVEYDWRSPEDHKTYQVPDPATAPQKASSAPPPPPTGRWQRLRVPRRQNQRFAPYRPATPDSALARRRRVYAQKLYSAHVGTNRISQYRNFTPETFSTSPQLQSRARRFIRRELQVFPFLYSSGHANAEFLLEYVIAILKRLEPKDSSGAAEELMQEFLGRENARLFLHELEQWLRSPYENLEDWDRHVQYAGADLDKNQRSDRADGGAEASSSGNAVG